MSRLPHPLSAGLLCGLLGVASSWGVHARELRPNEPLRVTLVSLARQATPPSQEGAPRLSVRRAWANETQARLCALTLDSAGQPVLDRGRFQVKRIQFQRVHGRWQVQRQDTAWLNAGGSLETACPKPVESSSPATQLAASPAPSIDVALAEMARNPPTAGMPEASRERSADARCPFKPETSADASGWRPGRIEAEGRTHLFEAPDRACPLGKHLVQHDKVRIGPTQGRWVQVQYTHPITQVVTVGWLPGDRAIAVDTQVAGDAR